MNKDLGIYIHIPFCTSKCHYCDFVSFCNKDELIEKYIDSVCNEILQNAEILSGYNIKTIYFGGGTPSYIDSKYITKILETLHLFCNKDNICSIETTIEVNPNSVTYEKMLEYKKSGINRVSIGLQTTHDNILNIIGRKHNLNDFINALNNCKKVGIDNISVDLIYPLPYLTLELFDNSLKYLMKIKEDYNINHISIYNLEIHENTKLDFLLKEGYLSLVNEDEEYEMKELLENALSQNGYIKYEISNWCIPTFESRHNINYWNQGIYLGFGVNASSFISGTRYKNTPDINEYLENKNCIYEKEELDKLDLMKEYVILRLRLKDGINISEFYSKFNTNILDIFNSEIKELQSKELIYSNNKNIYLTKRGFEVANVVWEKFI